jgi:hypothetical protein
MSEVLFCRKFFLFRSSALSQAEIGVGAIATLAWQCQIPPTCSRKREHGTPELRRDKALGVKLAIFEQITCHETGQYSTTKTQHLLK